MAKRKSSRRKDSVQSNQSKQTESSASRRSRTRERREEREKEKRRNQQVLIVGGLIVGAIILALLFVIANQPAEAPVPEELVARYEGIPQTQTDEGFYRLGNPEAPVRVEEFSSFSCPACETFFDVGMDTMIDLVREGAISFTFVPQILGSLQNPEGAARAAICAGEQGQFFEYHDMLFDWHSRFGNTAFSQNRLRSGAENLGLDTDEFNSCLTGSESASILDRGIDLGRERGISGTPSTYVNGSPVDTSPAAIQDAVQQALEFSGAQPVPLDLPDDTDETEATEEAVTTDDSDTVEATPEATDEASAATDDAEEEAESEDDADSEETPEATEEADE